MLRPMAELLKERPMMTLQLGAGFMQLAGYDGPMADGSTSEAPSALLDRGEVGTILLTESLLMRPAFAGDPGCMLSRGATTERLLRTSSRSRVRPLLCTAVGHRVAASRSRTATLRRLLRLFRELVEHGISVRGGDVVYVTSAAIRRVAIAGADQVPSTVGPIPTGGDFPPGAGVGLAFLDSRFVVTHPSSGYESLYSARGVHLTTFSEMFSSTATTSGKLLYGTGPTAIVLAQDVGKSGRLLATNQYRARGLCLHGGRLYFIAEDMIRYLDVE